MTARNRTFALVIAAVIIGAPAAIMRALCLGDLCDDESAQSANIPFCSLPDDLRRRVADGFRENRSPNVMAVTGAATVVARSEHGRKTPVWPSTESIDRSRVPIVFSGTGVSAQAEIADGTTLDAVAPTMAEIMGLDRPHPEVRSGTAIAGVADGTTPRLVLELVLEGVGSDDIDLDDWPRLRELADDGAATREGDAASLPLDPVAVLTTIGTGGVPRQHGIVGMLLRNDAGRLVEAWGEQAPVSVIAALADDLDELNDQRPMVGLAAPSSSSRGLIGGNWYVEVDSDEIVYSDDTAGAAEDLLREGFGRDNVPDLLAVVLTGRPRSLDRSIGKLVEAGREQAGGSLSVVVTATGSIAATDEVDADEVVAAIEDEVAATGEVVEAAASGGLFVNQKTLADNGISEDAVVKALRAILSGSGQPLVTDAFSAIAVSFARYC